MNVRRASGLHGFDRVEKSMAASDPLVEAQRNLFPPLRSRVLGEAAEALAAGRIDAAESLIAQHLRRQTNDPAALNLMADIARRRDRFEDAIELSLRCLKHSSDPGYRFNYAVLLRRMNRLEEADAQLDILLAQEPQNPFIRDQKAKLLHAQGKHEEAIAVRRKLVEAHSESAEAWLNYADSFRLAKRYDESVAGYRRALELKPSSNKAYPRLPDLKTHRFAADDVGWMQKQLAIPTLTADDRINLHFALAKACEDQKLYPQAFENYAKANALRRLSVNFDPERLTAHRKVCEALFTPEFFAERAGRGCPSKAPIFIVGMPRSGSTLLEQILSSHSAVEGLGELPDMENATGVVIPPPTAGKAAQPYALAVKELDIDLARTLAEHYLALAAARRITQKPFFTDKALANWFQVGVIQLILPNAKIVDMRRYPLDCGWSCFKSHFPKGQPFSHRLSEIGRHYSDYVRLMGHFDRVLPGRIHRVFYENLIEDPEGEIRRLLEYLELPFETQCLNFHENRRMAKTLSAEQVRTPLYKSGVGQWTAYEHWLGPLKAALGPVLDAYPNAPE
ncbi:MAG TPA: sulfotransferase [Rhizomicrobium sp.]|nr:sulfotransferase [Rhizomicrobium sp.]